MRDGFVPSEARCALPPTGTVFPGVPTVGTIGGGAPFVDATVVPVLLAPRLLKFVPVAIVPCAPVAIPRTPVVSVSPPSFFPLFTPGTSASTVLALIAVGEGIRPLDAPTVTVPLLAPLVRPTITVTVVWSRAVRDRTFFCTCTLHLTVAPVVLVPHFVPFGAVGLRTPLVRLSHDVLRGV